VQIDFLIRGSEGLGTGVTHCQPCHGNVWGPDDPTVKFFWGLSRFTLWKNAVEKQVHWNNHQQEEVDETDQKPG
jgi:hypothetical protein